MFRNRGNSSRIIHLHNIDGTRTVIEQPGKLNQATHQTVLQALGQRASRFRVGGRLVASEATSHSWSLVDETGTTNASLNREEIQQQERIDIRGVSDEILQVHGIIPGHKDDEIIRLLYENTNGIPNRLGGNEKLDKAKELIDKLGADVLAYNKH